MLRIKKKRAVCWRGGYFGYYFLTGSLRDSKSQLRTAMRQVHRWICRHNHRGIQNGSSVRWRDRFTDEKCRQNHRGIQNGSSIRWRVLFTVRIADGITDEIFHRWIHRQKLIYPLSLDLILPYFFFFFLISTLPNCKHPTPPPKKNLPLLSTTSHISWSLIVTESVFWFTYGFLSVFVSNSIFLNFNI